ncbi:MAG: acetate--CoA ligase [Chlamydiales bacterium]|nr:acetate--CoA ligase [Chlamydiales bacterium]
MTSSNLHKPELSVVSPIFYPSDDFKEQASHNALDLYLDAKLDPELFWAKQAHHLTWFSPWKSILEWNSPYAKWFSGGHLNACYNCVDRHIETETRSKAAIIWEGERGESRTLTYQDLYNEVNKCANVLKSLGVAKGDTVAIYMPMIPEAIIAMLAAARIGAVHTVVFGGFSADALKERIIDAHAKVVITADGGFRKGGIIRLKDACDQALKDCPSVTHTLVVQHAGNDVTMTQGKDYWYHECMQNVAAICEPESMEAEDRLFILYTSGTTGKPKGIVHTTGGYMVSANRTTAWVFDLKPNDVYWCTADVGWITGHTYVVYGPLSNGATQVIYEGSPDFPQKDRYWKLIEKYGVTILYTAPTAIRTFMKWGTQWPEGCNLSSLRLLGSVGEPINPEAWMWYHTHIGHTKCPIVDTWWQTETGSIMIAPLPGSTPLKPASATFALPGVDAAILDDEGKEQQTGFLAIKSPWPSMLRGIHNDPERFYSTYWEKWNGKHYFTSDGAVLDSEGYFWLMGRVDDVMNISGHRIGTMEVESALVDYPQVAEAAVVGIAHAIKGQGIVAFVLLKDSCVISDDIEAKLKQHVVEKIGAIARPERIIITRDLPKTRSGKIMRRLLRDIAEGRVLGDLTTLADASVIQELKHMYED